MPSSAEAEILFYQPGAPARRILGLTLKRLLIVLLLMMAAWQLSRQVPPVKTDGFLWDFSNVYSASKVFLHGGDPFKIDNVFAAWNGAPHSPLLAPENHSWLWVWCAVYPPPSLVMIAPLAAMTPAAAHVCWIVLDLVLFALVCAALWDLGGIKTHDDRLLLVACLLAAAPVIDIFQSGQLGFPACAGVILAVWAVRHDRDLVAGVLLGLATAVKFQVAGPFIVFYLLVRRWRVGTTAAMVFAAICLVGVIPLEMHHYSWLSEWLRNTTLTLQPGQGNDPRPGGPFRNDIINVQNWLYAVISNDETVRALAIVLVCLPASAFLVGLRHARRPADDLLALSCVALLSFLPLYRRLYDATVLAMLLTWAIAALRTPMRRSALITLVLLAELLVPIEMVPMVLRHVPSLQSAVPSRFWQLVVIPHHAWAVLLLTFWVTGLYLALHPRIAPLGLAADDEVDLSEAVTS